MRRDAAGAESRSIMEEQVEADGGGERRGGRGPDALPSVGKTDYPLIR